MLLAVLSIISFAFADVGLGTMYVSHIEIPGTEAFMEKTYLFNLIVTDDTVQVSKRITAFLYDPMRGIKKYDTEKYLNLNAQGRLVSEDQPNGNFGLVVSEDQNGRSILTYEGDKRFELCPDNTIGLNSKCEEGRRVIITYEEFL